MIETERLRIYAASGEQMEAFIAEQADEVLKEAYTDMYSGCLFHSDQWEWYAIWMIKSQGGTHIGELCFKGIDENDLSEIGYGIAEDYRGCGYATEVVSAVSAWALRKDAVKAVTAEVDRDNIASVRLLEKSGFILTGRSGKAGRMIQMSSCLHRYPFLPTTCVVRA